MTEQDDKPPREWTIFWDDNLCTWRFVSYPHGLPEEQKAISPIFVHVIEKSAVVELLEALEFLQTAFSMTAPIDPVEFIQNMIEAVKRGNAAIAKFRRTKKESP